MSLEAIFGITNKLVIIGAGGHGLVCADIAKLLGYIDINFLDDDIDKNFDYRIIGKIDDFVNYLNCDFFIALGNNQLRESVFNKLNEKKCKIINLIHPSAVIAHDVKLGNGIAVMANSVVNSKCEIKNGVIINTAATVDHECIIKDFVHISPGAHLAGNVHVGERCWLGIGSIVSNNISICNDCLIGAGGVCVKNINILGTYYGNPIKLSKEGNRNVSD